MRRYTDGCIFILLYKQDTLIWNGDTDFICFGVLLNQDGNTPLLYACYSGLSDLAVKLIENGAAIDAKDAVGIEQR